MTHEKSETHGKGGHGGGQQKMHEATRTNPTTGEVETRVFTQQEWKQRDKSEGWERPDEGDEGEGDDVEVVDPTTDPTSGGTT